MPSRRTEVRHAGLRRCTEALLAATLIVLGWTHGVLYVEGGSMEPALYPGDLIVYRKGADAPDHGDLVVFEHQESLVVHRVAALLRDGTLRTRGDANESVDSEPVVAGDVRGEVLLILPAGRAVHALAAWCD